MPQMRVVNLGAVPRMVVPTGSRHRWGGKGASFPIQNLMASRTWDRMTVHTICVNAPGIWSR